MTYGPDDLDPGLLLWDVRRYLSPGTFGERRVVIQMVFPSVPAKHRYYWVVVDEDEVDPVPDRSGVRGRCGASTPTCVALT